MKTRLFFLIVLTAVATTVHASRGPGRRLGRRAPIEIQTIPQVPTVQEDPAPPQDPFITFQMRAFELFEEWSNASERGIIPYRITEQMNELELMNRRVQATGNQAEKRAAQQATERARATTQNLRDTATRNLQALRDIRNELNRMVTIFEQTQWVDRQKLRALLIRAGQNLRSIRRLKQTSHVMQNIAAAADKLSPPTRAPESVERD